MSDARPVVVRPGEGRSIDLGNFGISVNATAEEAFYFLAGEYNIFVRGEEYACPAGWHGRILGGIVMGIVGLTSLRTRGTA